jgi:hypothetical protein
MVCLGCWEKRRCNPPLSESVWIWSIASRGGRARTRTRAGSRGCRDRETRCSRVVWARVSGVGSRDRWMGARVLLFART